MKTINDIDLSPEVLLPHHHPMIIIDEIIAYGTDYVIAQVKPGPGKQFATDIGCVPVWVGLEYMAQTIAAFAGVQAQLTGGPIKIGLLLGTRAFLAKTEQFENGVIYFISAEKMYQDELLSAFECTIFHEDGAVQTTATINTYLPD